MCLVIWFIDHVVAIAGCIALSGQRRCQAKSELAGVTGDQKVSPSVLTVQALEFVAETPWSLWVTSYSIIADTRLRSTDYCRLGKNHGFETKDLLQHLERLEDEYLSSLSLNSVFS